MNPILRPPVARVDLIPFAGSASAASLFGVSWLALILFTPACITGSQG